MSQRLRIIPVVLMGLWTGGCASTGAPPDRTSPLDRVDWSGIDAEIVELLAEITRVDTSSPEGRNTDHAARVVAAFLERHGVHPELVPVGPGQLALFARIPSSLQDPEAPMLLASYLDTLPADATFWPKETPPFGGVIDRGQLFGRGVLSGKGAATLHAATMALLAAQRAQMDRDLMMVVVPDGTKGGVEGLDRMIRRHPDVATASIAITPSGIGVDDWLGDDRIVHHATSAVLGFVRLEIAAVRVVDREEEDDPTSASRQRGSRTARNGAELDANLRLARALQELITKMPGPEISPAAMSVLAEVADDSSLPGRLLLENDILCHLTKVQSLAARSVTRRLVSHDLRVVHMAGGFDRRGTSKPMRARATVFVHLLPGTTPEEMKAHAERVIRTPGVHVTLDEGAAASVSARSRSLEAILRRHLPIDRPIDRPIAERRQQIVAFGYAASPSMDRALQRIGVRTYGALPFVITAEELAAIEGLNERVSLENLQRGLRKMVAIVADATLAKLPE